MLFGKDSTFKLAIVAAIMIPATMIRTMAACLNFLRILDCAVSEAATSIFISALVFASYSTHLFHHEALRQNLAGVLRSS